MRRLVGLIALLVLILGAAWLARIDFDLTRIADFDTLFEPASEGEAHREVAVAPATAPAAAPEASQAEAEAAQPGEGGAEVPSGDAPHMAVGKPMPDEFDTTGPSSPDMATADAERRTDASMVAEPVGEGAPPIAPPAGIVPSFDIVRVEPSGETVIAGVAQPEAMVEILNGPEPVASAEANERGEWALVLEAPLPPGTHDLGIRTTSPDRSQVTLSDQRVVVSVPESADEAPLVVINQPDAPSRVMQLPGGAETAAGSEVAAAPQAQADAMAEPPPSGEAEVASAPQAEPTTEMSAASDEAKMATSSSEAAPPPASMEAPSSGTGAASAPAPTPMAGPSDASGVNAAPPETKAMAETNAVPAPMSAPSATSDGSAPSTARRAGTGSETMPATSESAAADTMAAGTPAAAGSEAPAGTGETTSEMPSAPEPSSTTELAATPSAPPETLAAPETAAGETSAAESEAKPPMVVEAPPPPTPEVGVAAVEAETNGALYIAGTATTPEPVRVYVDDEFLGEATPTESGTWLLETRRELAPDEYTVRADQVDAGSGTVVARAEVPFAREIAVAKLKPVGESVAAGTSEASGSVAGPMTVIIKRGDNLWRISREMYGRGIRFSTIYQANRDQIRNPNWIYPGQVFVLPAGDSNWEAQ